MPRAARRLEVRKTYKLFVAGQFPRSESGRTYAVARRDGATVNVSRGSRKDLRDAVRAARGALAGWSARSGYNRGQVLYRVAEVMESRRTELADEVRAVAADGTARAKEGGGKRSVGAAGVAREVPAAAARREVERAIDRWVWYAGWADKFGALFGGVNPVAGPFYNFTIPEPTGVVGLVAVEAPSLLGLVSRLAPVLVSGNTAVVLPSQTNPLPAIALAEVLVTSDVPPGVVNVVTGLKAELVPVLAAHRDVNALDASGAASSDLAAIEAAAADNVKRVRRPEKALDWFSEDAQSPYAIAEFTEFKTVWHPIGL